MRKHVFLITFLFVSSFSFSQQKTISNHNLPISIYTATFNIKMDTVPSYASINKKLNFNTSYQFTTITFEDIDAGRFLISDTNLSTKSTKFIYDDYKNYRDENLLKGFLQKYDLTRWNPCNFRQPSID